MESPRKSKLIRITVWAAALGLLLGVLSSLAMAGSADAHAVLKSISPEDGARLTAPPTEVELTFNEPISSSFATVTVAGADGGSASSGKARVSGTTVTQPLADLPDGRFTVTFHVVSEDGHPVSGRSTFTVVSPATNTSPAATATTVPPATSSAAISAPSATAAAESDDGDGRPLRLGLAIGVAGLAIAAGLALVARSRRDGAH